jgi:hypothetical protein
MRPDRGSTPPPTPARSDTEADATSSRSPDTPPVVSRRSDDLERAGQNELERPTLIPEIDLEALAKLGPEAFAHSKQRLPADLFGPGGKPRPVRTSLPPGASMAPSAPSGPPPAGGTSVRPAPFDLDEVDVFFDSDNKISIPPPRTMHDEVVTGPPDLSLDATAELYATGAALVPPDARRTSRPPVPPAAPTVPRQVAAQVALLADDTDTDEPTLSDRLAPPPPPAAAPRVAPSPPPATSPIETLDAIDALGMLDNPDSWDAGELPDLSEPRLADTAEREVSRSLRPLAAATLDALSQLDEPDHDSGIDDDLAVPLVSPLPPTRPQIHDATALADLGASSVPPPIESLPSDLLSEDEDEAPVTATEDELVADAGADEAMEELRARFAAHDYLGALHVAETLHGDRLHAEEAEQIAHECRTSLTQRYVESIGSLARVPVIAVPLSVIRELPIDNRAGFVLSRIDGISSLEMILDMSGMPQLDALRIVYELIQNGALDFV